MPKGKGYGTGKKVAPTVERNNFNSSGTKKPAPAEKEVYGHNYSRMRTPPAR